MKIVIAPDSYKESLSATEVAQAIEKGFREIFPDALYVKVPLADGGEGTVEAMIAATQGTEMSACVTGPLGVPVNACWGLSGDGKTAFIEMAAASGLGLVPPAQRNPLLTTSRGTGELILQALDHGAKNIIIGIGGSATNECQRCCRGGVHQWKRSDSRQRRRADLRVHRWSPASALRETPPARPS